jgi:hypothetical protein
VIVVLLFAVGSQQIVPGKAPQRSCRTRLVDPALGVGGLDAAMDEGTLGQVIQAEIPEGDEERG